MRKIVAEEIEIIVTARVEEALREFKKMLPEIKKQMKQAQTEFNKVDMKSIATKTQSAIQQVKQKIGELKGSNTDKALQQQFEKASASVVNYRQQLEQTKEQLRQVYAQMDVKQDKAWKQYTPEGIELGNKGIEPAVNQALSKDKEYQNLINQETKLNQKVQELNQKLQQAKESYKSIGSEVQQVQSKQSIFTTMAGKMNSAFKTIKSQIGGAKSSFNGLPNITAKVTANIKQMSTGMKQGLVHILKYAGALFSLRGVYSVLSSSANSWLSSQNAGAKQLSTNIDYMKNAMGSALAPIIQWVTGLIYNLMKAIQSIVYALFKVNIFAKASAKSYASMAGSAKKAKNEAKQLAGVHDEINNIQNNNNADGGSGSGSGTPSFDLSGIDSQMSPLAQKLYDFFKPLKESWDIYGPALVAQIKTTASQVGYLLSSVWGSFEKIITNGTVYMTLQLIFAIIGNIAEAFANAWNYNGNGDIIIQNLANALNNLLTAINNFVTSDMFQEWLNRCSDKLAEMSGKLAEIDWQPIINGLGIIGMTLGTIVLTALDLFISALEWLSKHPDVATVLLAIGAAITIVGVAISIVSSILGVILPILTTIQTISALLNIGLLATAGIITGVIVAVAAAIAIVVAAVVLLAKHWDEIKAKTMEIWNAIIEALRPILEEMAGAFKEAWDVIKLIWDMTKPYFQAIWEAIKAIFSVVVEVIGGFFRVAWEVIKAVWNVAVSFFALVWAGIKAVFAVVKGILSGDFSDAWEAIKNVWSRVVGFFKSVWDGIKNIFSSVASWFSNVFSAAWNAVKAVINVGIAGIEGMINNGIVAPLNVVLRGLNGIVSAAGKVIGIDIAIPTLNSVSIPRLAKGNVAYDETLAIFGEYAGASNNPEITAPQSILEETFERVLSRNGGGNNQPISLNLTVKVGDKKLGTVLIEDLRSIKRQTGKDLEVLIGG